MMNDRKYLDVQLGDVIVEYVGNHLLVAMYLAHVSFLRSHNIEDYTRPQSSAHLKSALLDVSIFSSLGFFNTRRKIVE